MKKKLYSLIIAIVVLALLFGIYLFASGKSSDETEENTDESISMEDLGTQITSLSNVDTFTLKNKNGDFTFNKKGDTWGIDGYNNSFNSSVLDTMSRVFSSLYAESIIEENAQDMSKYSLDTPIAVASSGDTTINLGSLTTDGKYYYVSLNNNKTVYMVNSARLNCLEYGLNDMIDKSLPKIDSDTVQELSISYKGEDKDNIVVKYDADNPLAREYAEKNGLATLVMEEPVENMLVYPYNLQGSVLVNLDSLNISDLVEISPSDLSKYGLDSPACSIYIADKDNSISVKTGDFVPDTNNEYAEKNGLATLVMEEPVENMLVYPYNLQGSVLVNLDSLNISDLVEISPSDLSKYGLDSPACSIYIADKDNSISVKTGDFVPDTNNEYVYVMVNDRPEVFTMAYNAIRPFEDASVADFVEKFISIYQRSKVNKITIEGDKTYTVDFKAEGENDFREVDEGVTQDFRNTYINNKLIDRDTFTDFYELLVGIGFDDIIPHYEIQGEPEVTITFELSDGSTDTAHYYNYDNTFYVVNKGGNDESALLVSKQTVRKVLSEAENLSK